MLLDRSKNDGEVYIGSGVIRLYKSQGVFEATCSGDNHTRCRLTRMRHGNPAFPDQGRPLGLLAAWLLCGDIGIASNEVEHHDDLVFALFDFDERVRCRALLHIRANSNVLFNAERAQRDDEPNPEPRGQP